MNKYYTAQEVAERLKIKKTTVYELIKRGELPSSKIGKQLRISEEQLERYLKGTPPKSPFPLPTASTQEPESSILKRDYLLHTNGFILSGQTGPALELLYGYLQNNELDFPYLHSHMNTYNGLYALYFNKVHIASAAGLTPEAIQALVPGMALELLYLYDYWEGFYVKKGNPRAFSSVADFQRDNIILANREKGSTRRMHLDELLKEAGIAPDMVSGYGREYLSDAAAASAIIRQLADVSLGEEALLWQYPDLEFSPYKLYPVYLVYPQSLTSHPALQLLIDTVQSPDFRESLSAQTGYDISHTGSRLQI